MTEFRTASDVREHLIGALEADLIGPYDAVGLPDELLPQAPSRWYLTGFLAPKDGALVDNPEDQGQTGAGGNDTGDTEDEEATEPRRSSFFPSSIGLSALVPHGAHEVTLDVQVRWADYTREHATRTSEAQDAGTARAHWRREPRQGSCRVDIDSTAFLNEGVPVPGSDGLVIRGLFRRLTAADCERLHMPAGASAVSVFLVNERAAPEDRADADTAFAFQVELSVSSSTGWINRENMHDAASNDIEARTLDLQFRTIRSWASGHGVAVVGDGIDVEAGIGHGRLRTTWLPHADVHRVAPREPDQLVPVGDVEGAALGLSVEVKMAELARAPDGEAIRRHLRDLPAAYARWIESQRKRTDIDSEARSQTRDQLVAEMQRVCDGIQAGIELIATDETARRAFCLANEAMHDQTVRPASTADWTPAWRLFQLAFILLALPSTLDPTHDDRDEVELIYFPTGGGKTEAYLGLIATSLVYRRLAHGDAPHQGLGVAVLLRYTLRLLTLDQLERASALICALERLRRRSPDELGTARFSIGLWVGRSATANRLKDLPEAKRLADRTPGASAAPLTACPWCGGELDLHLEPTRGTPEVALLGCKDNRDKRGSGGPCPFTRADGGVPLLWVDEQIYRELPCFVVATVDKFALLPWRAEVGKLFGQVAARADAGAVPRFFAEHEKPSGTTALPDGLLPPDTIVQDELHLISGPLGSMVGLFETAIQELSAREINGQRREPKIVASTATVRRAQQQVHRLYGRSRMRLFPPAGVDDGDRFFAVRDHESDGRRYLGVSAQGRSMQRVLARVYTALLAASEVAWAPSRGGKQPADAYRTLVGYFNALRDLGSMRRVVEDQVRQTVEMAEHRIPLNATAPHRWFAERTLQHEPLELTSRASGDDVKVAKRRLAEASTSKERVDVALASNMISVGLDISRLGLMVVASAPKSTSEYIQATSRVGRQSDRPGLVVTVYNAHRARDRSQYEHFETFHTSFYREVEATSVTPFAPPTLARALSGVLVALARHGRGGKYALPTDVVRVLEDPETRRYVERVLVERAARTTAEREDEESLKALASANVHQLLDSWSTLARDEEAEADALQAYSPWDDSVSREKKALLTPFDKQAQLDDDGHAKRFVAPSSMRDVEATAPVWVFRRGEYLQRKRGDGNAT